ncbi:amino acid ABC transporter substrate-binding protein [Bordetella genomosp. 8]|uniref:Amino acid ABC transporter substrate-binding protein n=1 Tax=Bordetella genomosp. 8 TaxID=1416806 RepID=A0A1W6YT08_9BORD|nr:amino acid ABC transporter substrate-binding protein [Bordetella genomosp. 8]ARP84230.1 amino acid ABC transporter substrate-binding protein [Bordetella genomosp. 8]
MHAGKRKAIAGLATMFCATLAHAGTLERIQDTGQINVAHRESSVPFSYLDGPGRPAGFSVDISLMIVNAIKKELGRQDLKVNWISVTPQNRTLLLNNGTIDLECEAATNNSNRWKDVNFSVNYFYTGTRLLVKRDAGIKNYADLKGKRVATTAGSSNLLMLRKYNAEQGLGMKLVPARDHADALLMLESDRVAAFAMDDVILYGLKSTMRDPTKYDVLGDDLHVEPYACMLPKDDQRLKTLVDKTIGGAMTSGAFTKLYDKWFQAPIPPNQAVIGMPMGEQLRANVSGLSDQPSF